MILPRRLFVLSIALFILFSFGCRKKSELGELSPESNIFAPENPHTEFFIVDSIQVNAYPYVQLYYHIRYDLIPDASLISKIVIYRDGELALRLSPTQVNVYYPRDLNVYHSQTYAYTFAFEEADGTLSFFSNPHYVHVP
ncbi:MAG: hypothetical protein JWO09_2519 [Bacteroidetes bacterium]|nr:hypothetical protein [Bacteroidota bacterium]